MGRRWVHECMDGCVWVHGWGIKPVGGLLDVCCIRSVVD